MVYDSGTIFEPAILDIKPEDLRVKFTEVKSVIMRIHIMKKFTF
jgi:hypothetical protein